MRLYEIATVLLALLYNAGKIKNNFEFKWYIHGTSQNGHASLVF